jgi:hypothetical protein
MRDEVRGNGGELLAAVLMFAVLLYFLPTVLAGGRRHLAGVALLNLVLGWTLLGWLVAFAWASAGRQRALARHAAASAMPTEIESESSRHTATCHQRAGM